jgi:hypothetical protein
MTSSVASAHDADLVAVQLSVGEGGVVTQRMSLSPATLSLLIPRASTESPELDELREAIEAGVWGEVVLSAQGLRCPLMDSTAALHQGSVELSANFRCGAGPLRIDFRFLAILPPNYRVSLRSTDAPPQFAQGNFTALWISLPAAAPIDSRFLGGLAAGAQRAFNWGALVSVWALLMAIGSWPTGKHALMVLLGAAVLASSLGANVELLPVVLVLLALGLFVPRIPVNLWAMLLGGALGARSEGHDAVSLLGWAVGLLGVLAPGGMVALSVAVMLRRRPRVLRWVKWGMVLLMVGVALSAARGVWW